MAKEINGRGCCTIVIFLLISAESAPWLVRLRIFCLRDQRKVPGANRLKVGPATTNDDQQEQHTSIVPKSQ